MCFLKNENVYIIGRTKNNIILWRSREMRIILDTDKKTITVPWNYSAKLEAINNMIRDAVGDDSKKKTFSGYLIECWEYAMKHSDTNLKTAQKPKRPTKED